MFPVTVNGFLAPEIMLFCKEARLLILQFIFHDFWFSCSVWIGGAVTPSIKVEPGGISLMLIKTETG